MSLSLSHTEISRIWGGGGRAVTKTQGAGLSHPAHLPVARVGQPEASSHVTQLSIPLPLCSSLSLLSEPIASEPRDGCERLRVKHSYHVYSRDKGHGRHTGCLCRMSHAEMKVGLIL